MTRLVSCLVVALCAISTASAQPTDLERVFQEGNAALRAGRFHQARDLLREAHASAAAVGTAFNLAVALRGTGEVVECDSLFGRLLDGRFGDVSDAVAQQAEGVREECRQVIATLTIRVDHTATVRVDGEDIGVVEAGEAREVRLDPGAHVVTTAREGFMSAEERVDLARSGSAEISLELIVIVTPALLNLNGELEAAEPPPRPLVRRGWFWVVVTSVVLIAGAFAVGFALRDPSVADPVGSPWADPQVIP